MNRPKRTHGRGENTLSFNPESSTKRPDMRILVADKGIKYIGRLTHDDVVIVKNFFDEPDMYNKLLSEIKEIQERDVKNSEYIEWHEGSHLITKNPDESPTFQYIIKRLAEYYDIDLETYGTRFNWYRNNNDWKPFHHDSAAFNRKRAVNQNITVGVSFGSSRELAFHHVKGNTRLSFPQENNMVFSFGKDVNIRFMHGVNALKEEEKLNNNDGRISIILWGKTKNVIDQENSPSMIPERKHNRHHNKRNISFRKNGHNRYQ